MTGENFVERVHAYSKWLLGLETESQEGIVETPRIPPEVPQIRFTSRKVASGRPLDRARGSRIEGLSSL
jgi:hypothetical protein